MEFCDRQRRGRRLAFIALLFALSLLMAVIAS